MTGERIVHRGAPNTVGSDGRLVALDLDRDGHPLPRRGRASNTSLSTIWFHSPNGASLTFFDVPYYTPVSFVLPVGQYTIQANGTGAPCGVATNSTAIATAYLLTGNSAADLTLAYSFRHTASLTVVPPTKVTVSGGTRVSFSLAISNTGNAPETLKLSGTPSYWNFTFSPANVTLGVTSSNRSASAQVSILVPAGTPVAHPTIQIEAIVASTGAVAGFATPLPEVDVLPVTGLTLGSGAISGAVISPYTAVVPFWVLNTGNLPEGIVFSVADAARLSGLGWESKIVSGRTAVVSTQLVQPGQNSTYSVELISPAGPRPSPRDRDGLGPGGQWIGRPHVDPHAHGPDGGDLREREFGLRHRVRGIVVVAPRRIR